MGVKLSPLRGTFPPYFPHPPRCCRCKARLWSSLKRSYRATRSQPRRLIPLAASKQVLTTEEKLPWHSKFTEEDLQRIKEHGPSIDDLKQQHEIIVDDGSGVTSRAKVEYISPKVLGTPDVVAEPRWEDYPKMSRLEFFHGLRKRNWKSEYFEPGSDPWRLQFFVDSGRLFRPSFSGYKVLVTSEAGSVGWVDLPDSGVQNFLEDATIEREVSGMPTRINNIESPSDFGYNQVLEQLHLAFEERIHSDAAKQYSAKGWVRAKKPIEDGQDTVTYDCPGERLLNVSFHLTPDEPSLHAVWAILPSVLFVTFAFSFLGVCLTLGIFAPRKQMPTDTMQAMEFAQSKGKARRDGKTDTCFEDVAGLDSIIGDLKDIVNFLRDPSKYGEIGATPPKGILLDGPPGTGKTLIAKAIAGEAGVPFYQMSGSEFVEAIVGVGAARVRDLFKRARSQDEACIVFVDEIDALGIKRAEAGIQTNEEREQTLNQLLTEMDGFSSELGVVFVAATNRADLLDPALTRPGRFDRKIRVPKPDTDARRDILQVHSNSYPKLKSDVDLMQLARNLPGLSGAELENILNESALAALRRGGKDIATGDVYSAVDRILQGIRLPVDPKNMKQIGNVIAAHEMGRAIVAHVLRERSGRLEGVERVSMVPRSKDWSRTIFDRSSDEEYTLTVRSKMLDRIRVILSGRAAEDLLFEDPTTYGNKDLEAGYRLAAKIVANYGLSEMGITTYAPVSRGKAGMNRSFEVTTDNIDEDLFGKGIKGGMFQPSGAAVHATRMAARKIILEGYQECLDILHNYGEALAAGSIALLDKEEMTGEELAILIKKNPPLMPDEEMVIERAALNEALMAEDHTQTTSQAVSLETKAVSNMLARNANE